MDIEAEQDIPVREPTQDVICDFVDGFAFGEAIGVGIRSVSGWWTVERVALDDDPAEVILQNASLDFR